MSAIWVVTGLLAVITALNSVALIALIRQVGLLHLRIRPLPALQDADHPQPGAQLSFVTAPWDLPDISNSVERLLLGFFSPTCGICGPLMPSFQALDTSRPADEAVILVTDAPPDRAAEYLRAKGIRLPFIAESNSLKENNVPGAPFAIVVDRSGIVLSAGAVNTLEQIEWLLDRASTPHEDVSSDEDELEEVLAHH